MLEFSQNDVYLPVFRSQAEIEFFNRAKQRFHRDYLSREVRGVVDLALLEARSIEFARERLNLWRQGNSQSESESLLSSDTDLLSNELLVQN